METDVTDTPRLQARIDGYLRESGLAPAVTHVVPLTADASDRRYFRIVKSEGRSIVLALHAGAIDFARLPFANVCELFQRVPLPVPAILGHSDSFGVLALQDLGDVTLQAHFGEVSVPEQTRLYREAVELIVRLQSRGAELASERFVPYSMAFDVEKLTWELDFFVTHFLEAYREATPTKPERAVLSHEWRAVAKELASEPRVVCHRDYHSRNLMLHEGSLQIIDFQDARMGPDTYDLASLLRDSYIELSDGQRHELMAHFLALKGRGLNGAPDEFRRRFDLMALQRNLKALGTFGFQTSSRKNSVYVEYMPRTLEYVRRTLDTYPRFSRLRDVLARWIEELR